MEFAEERRAGLLEGDAGASEATVARTGKRHADAGADVAHDSGERLLPLVREFGAYGFEEGKCIPAKEPISGGNEGCKVAPLLEACPEVVFLLSGFLGSEDCVGVFGVVGLGIEVNNGDINEAVCGSRVQVAEKEICPVLFAPISISRRGVGWSIGRSSGKGSVVGREDHGLSGYTVVGSGFSVQGAYFTSKFIVTGMNEAANGAGHGVVDTEGFVAAITSGGKV